MFLIMIIAQTILFSNYCCYSADVMRLVILATSFIEHDELLSSLASFNAPSIRCCWYVLCVIVCAWLFLFTTIFVVIILFGQHVVLVVQELRI